MVIKDFSSGVQGLTASEAAHSLLTVLNAMPVGVAWANQSDLKIRFMNRKFTETFGYTVEDVVDLRQWIALAYPFKEDRDLARETWRAYFAVPDSAEHEIDPIELRVLCKDGTMKTIIQSGVILPEHGWALSAFVDITDRKLHELAVEEAERRSRENRIILGMLLQHSSELIILSPFDQSNRFVSPAVLAMTGFTAEEYLAQKMTDMIHPLDHERVFEAIDEIKKGNLTQVYEHRVLQKGGGYRWVEATSAGYVDPVTHQSGYVVTVRDISEQKRRDAMSASHLLELSKMAALDELTGIANRRTFNERFDRETLRHTRSVTDLSLLMVDVDYFKGYNDLYGHLAGDECIKIIASTLQRILRRDADLAARFGGEEFVILLPVTDGSGAEAIGWAIVEAVSSLAIVYAASPHGVVTVSVGVASSPAGSPLEQTSLLEQADQSLYTAKKMGRNTCQIYVPSVS